MGLNTKPVDKPEALILWEQCLALDLPLVAGGLMDQPYYWILQVAVIRQEEQQFDIIEEYNRRQEQLMAQQPGVLNVPPIKV